MTVQDKLRALITVHCATIKDSVGQVETSLARLYGPADRHPGVIEEARGLTHQLKGSSGSIGFREVSNAATVLDDFLKSVCGIDRRLDNVELQRIFHLLHNLKSEAAAISPEHSSLYHAELDRPARRADGQQSHQADTTANRTA